MLQLLLTCGGAALAIAVVLLVMLGHRMRSGHWLVSVLTAEGISAAAWWICGLAAGGAPPLGATLATAGLVGVAAAKGLRRWNAIGQVAFSAAVITSVFFLVYATRALLQSGASPSILAAGIFLLTLQVGALTLLITHTFEIIDVLCRTRWLRRGKPGVRARRAPMVSLHVPIHNEPPELVIQSLNALSRLDYRNYEVLVIDNNTEEERLWKPVKRHCERLGSRFRFFHLRPWPGYKAGALNFALGQTASEAEIVGVVDADYQVGAQFLADLVGHFADGKMAFVQTPQDYRDWHGRGRFSRALYLAYSYFFKVSMASRNERNGIIFAGTMGLVRRSALVEVGGWDEWCITEDAELSLRLLAAGYESLYVDRSYGRGVMPVDFAALKKQRFRWAFGGMQLLRLHARRLFFPGVGRLGLAQRLAYVIGGLQWLNDPLTLAFTVVLLTGSVAFWLGVPFEIQPLVAATIAIPPLIIALAVIRFFWAIRVRTGCTWHEAAEALTVLLALTWTTSWACLQGLVARRGRFMRTPKHGERPSVVESMRSVAAEFLLGGACTVAAVALAVRLWPELPVARVSVCLLLLWQAVIYLSAVQASLWIYLERRPRTESFRTRAGPAQRPVRVPMSGQRRAPLRARRRRAEATRAF